MTKYSVEKPLTIIVSVIAVLILGIISFTKLETNLLPSVDFPYVVVVTAYPGASPEKVEKEVTKPLESEFTTINGIKNITSSSNENSSMIILEFNYSVNMDSTIVEMNNKIMTISGEFNDNVSTPVLTKINPDALPVVVTSISSDKYDIKELTKIFEDELLPKIERIEGVGTAEYKGANKDNIKVKLNSNKIALQNQQLLDYVGANFDNANNQINNAKQELNGAKEELKNTKQTKQKEINKSLDVINNNLTEIDLNVQKTITNITNFENRNAELEIQKNQLEVLIKQLESNNQDTTIQRKNLLNIENEITQNNNKLSIFNNTLISLKENKIKITSTKNDLNDAKIELNSQILEAQQTINNSEKSLEERITELNNQKDNALKETDLKGQITDEMVKNILLAENFSMPAGYTSDNEYLVKIGEEFSGLDELKNLTILNIDGFGEIKLTDLADVYYSDNKGETYSKINGKDGILIAINKQSTASTSTVSKNVRKELKKLETKNIEFNILNDQGIYIDIVIKTVIKNILMGGILAIVVLFMFLKHLKPTIIVALSIPISVIGAVVLMYFTGVTLNIISLAGLALGIGMLVDNSIVVIENIFRLRSNGKSIKEASVIGVKQVSGAICASTLTTICVFVPILFVEGISRELFTDMGLTIAYSLLASLIIAVTLVPSLTSKLLTDKEYKRNHLFEKITDFYSKMLEKALNYKKTVLIIVTILFITSIIGITKMGTAFIPESDTNQISITIQKNSAGTEELQKTSDEVIDKIINIKGIDTIGSVRLSELSAITMYITVEDNYSSSKIINEIKSKTAKVDADISVMGSGMDMSSLTGSGLEINITGENLDKLKSISKDVEGMLKNIKGTENIDNGLGAGNNELSVKVNKNKAMQYNLTVAGIYSSISKSLTSESQITSIDNYPVIIVNDSTITKGNINDFKIDNIRLGDIAEINETEGLTSINHENAKRTITVTSEIREDSNIGTVSKKLEKKLSNYKINDGYKIEIAGENEMIDNTLHDLFVMLLLAISLIYLIMVAQFQSFLLPFIIMFTIPLAFTGGLLALWITGNELSVISMLGFLVLVGIVVNNGIVFITCVNQLIGQNINKRKALIQTGKIRLRPIVMTSLTTILGLVTLAFGIGNGADMLKPMAIVIIAGLLYSTLLTLFILPIMYEILNRKKEL